MTKLHPLIPAKASSKSYVLGLATSHNTLIVAGGVGGNYLKIARGNLKFTNVKSPGRGLRGACVKGPRVFVCGEYGHVSFSDDGGRSYDIAKGVKTSSCLFGLAYDTDGSIWVAGDKGYVARTKGGEAPVKFKRVKGTSSDIARIRTSSLGVLIPTDDGELWVGHDNKLRKTSLDSNSELMAAIVTTQHTILVVGENAEVWRSTDEGESFTKLNVGKDKLCGIAESEEGVVVVGKRGAVFLSTDDGLSFERVEHEFGPRTFWCAESIGKSVLIGGERGLVFAYGEKPVLASAESIAPPDESHLPEVLRAPKASTEPMPVEAFESKPTEGVGGIFVSDWLRQALAPKRGGLHADVRPLASPQVAWAQLRKALWANDRANMTRDEPSGIWSLLQSRDGLERSLGARIVNEKVKKASLEEDLLFQRVLYERYRGFVRDYKHDALEWFAEMTLAQFGLVEGAVRLLGGLAKETPYMGTGPFLRLRELLATCEEDVYQKTKRALLDVLEPEILASRLKGDNRRPAYLRWMCNFVLPMGPQSGDDEETLHGQAMGHLKKFGDFGVHNAGLASGNALTLEAYNQANAFKNGHQFFDRAPHRLYLASLLEHAALFPKDYDRVVDLLVAMKPSSPWADHDGYNGIWCKILAHIDDDRARKRILKEHKAGHAWGTWKLRLAHSFSPKAVSVLCSDDEVVNKAVEVAVDLFPLHDLAEEGAPFSGESVHQESSLYALPPQPEGSPAPQVVFKHGERRKADQYGSTHYDPKWNGKSLGDLTDEEGDALVEHLKKYSLSVRPADLWFAQPKLVQALLPLPFATDYSARHTLDGVVSRLEIAALPQLFSLLKQDPSDNVALRAARFIGDVRLGEFMIHALSKKKLRTFAEDWISRHREHAATVSETFAQHKKAKVRASAEEMAVLAQDSRALPLLELPDLNIGEQTLSEGSEIFVADLGDDVVKVVFDQELVVLYSFKEKASEKFPRLSKTNDPDLVKALKKSKRVLNKSFEDENKREAQGFFLSLYCGGQTLSLEEFQNLCAHPASRSLAERFVWDDGERFLLGERTPRKPLRMAHPIELSDEEIELWQERTLNVATPFEQFERTILQETSLKEFTLDLDMKGRLSALGFWRSLNEGKLTLCCDYAPIRIDERGQVDFGNASARAISECIQDIHSAVESTD